MRKCVGNCSLINCKEKIFGHKFTMELQRNLISEKNHFSQIYLQKNCKGKFPQKLHYFFYCSENTFLFLIVL